MSGQDSGTRKRLLRLPSPGMVCFLGLILVFFLGFFVYPLSYVVVKAYSTEARGILAPFRREDR